jgi:hypothetical protein
MRVASITLVLLFFAWVPLAFLGYGALNGLLGGILLLAPFIALQFALLRLLKRLSAKRELKPRQHEE